MHFVAVSGIASCSHTKLFINRRLVSSVDKSPVYCAGGRGYKPHAGPTLRVLK